jgi:hypothetical protein
VLHGRADGLDDAAELVAQDVALLALHDLAVHDVHVAAAHGGACYFDDGVVVFD